ncbi:MAG TPA: pseudouridine synthase [Anaerolineae bacterium]|nr:pseudouridine synthase [Anaerolineae bacterium]HOR00432.1 pseudouridine synthase [Anaerolineae bacterium]HPL30195.1 pseudouridine synthase [Anaerolineae bacterium]
MKGDARVIVVEERLQKVLAQAGVASRRRAEEMIVAGHVKVNGEVVTQLGTKVNPHRDVIQVDGQTLGKPERPVYILLNKPRGVLSAARDTRGRKTVVDLVRTRSRLYPVGRLDLDSEGLLLLTNDGALALRLAHPRYEHEKEYRVLVAGVPGEEALARLRGGVGLEGGWTRPAQVEIEREVDGKAWLRLVLREGRKRQIRRMVEVVGHQVLRLIRVRMGPLRLGSLAPGAYRPLTKGELLAVRRIRRDGEGAREGRGGAAARPAHKPAGRGRSQARPGQRGRARPPAARPTRGRQKRGQSA